MNENLIPKKPRPPGKHHIELSLLALYKHGMHTTGNLNKYFLVSEQILQYKTVTYFSWTILQLAVLAAVNMYSHTKNNFSFPTKIQEYSLLKKRQEEKWGFKGLHKFAVVHR